MRNKGFFWFLTILLAVISLYQISFTFVSNSVEAKVAKEVDRELAELKAEAAKTGDSLNIDGIWINFAKAEGLENARVALINQKLKEKADTKVYPLLGSTFSTVKKRSLAFGLDLVGGMSVTMEVNIPELVKSYARSERDPKFKNVHTAAMKEYASKGGDFVAIFARKHKEINNGLPLVSLFSLSDLDGLTSKSSDSDVISFLKDRVKSSMDGIEEIINQRVNQFGVSQPNIQKDEQNNRLYVELPGVQDEKTVADQLQSTANLQFFETYRAQDIGAAFNDAITLSTKAEVAELDVEEIVNDSTDVSVDDILSLDEDKATGVKGLGDYFMPVDDVRIGFVSIENRGKVDQILAREDIKRLFPDDLKFMWSNDVEKINKLTGYFLYAIKVPSNGKARVGGRDIERAAPDINQNGVRTVTLKMTTEGAEKWALMTSENINRSIAITMDNLVFSAPNVMNAIQGGNTEITGNFSFEDATKLAGLLNGGALPAPCVIKEQTKVGPTVGAENTKSSMISFGISLALIFAFMIFYYNKAGIVANIALVLDILFIFGTLASFSAVLTLAGIAGIVLTIAMAIDANVLIFERIREELDAGKSQDDAIEEGYGKALSSIIDANVTTILTAIVLKVLGSGPIESFAITLIIGLITSVFAGVVITRLIFYYLRSKGKNITFSTGATKGMFKHININWAGNRKKYYVFTIVTAVFSLVMLFTKGLNPSVEFSGGRTYVVKFEKPVANELNYLEGNIRTAFGAKGKEASLVTKTKGNSFNVEIITNHLLGDESANNVVLTELQSAFEKSKEKLGSYQIVESRTVSPTISDDLKTSSLIAVIFALIIIAAYIMIRFGKYQYSTGALVSLAYNVLFTLGIFSLFNGIMPFNMDVDQAFIAAILTVIGYAINDTVIVFDRIRENLAHKSNRADEEEINLALNSTLSRTIITSVTTFVVLLLIFIFGGAAIRGFIFALMLGVIIGTFSSLCVATPILIDLSKKKSIRE